MPTIDFPIILKLGGRKRVCARLTEIGEPRNLATLRQWSWRRRIPGDAQAALRRMAEQDSLEVTYIDFEWPAAQSRAAA